MLVREYTVTEPLVRRMQACHMDEVCAVGVTNTGMVVMEVLSSEKKQYSLLADPAAGLVYHFCRYTGRRDYAPGQPGCWHLALAVQALIAAGRQVPRLPVRVKVVPEHPAPLAVIRDLTQLIAGRPGAWQKNELRLEKLATTPPEQTVRTAPVGSLPDPVQTLALPALVREKVAAFRRKAQGLFATGCPGQVPRGVYYELQGKELAVALTALFYGPGGQNWEPVLLRGPRGTGKSTLVAKLAEVLSLPLWRISGSEDHDLDALLGTRTLRNGEVCFQDGVITRAVREGGLLVLDEVNMLRPAVVSVLHPLLERRNRSLYVPGEGIISPPDTFRLIACMNMGYVGTTPLNEAFKDRFRVIDLPYPSVQAIARIIREEAGCSAEVADRLARVFDSLRQRSQSGGHIDEDALSVRSLIRAALEVIDSGVCELKLEAEVAAANITAGIDDDHTRFTVSEVVAAVYGERGEACA